MTQRERQILRWIEENPMISQQELADKAGITRSSAAVHISNLMKQGHIAGRGYIVRTAPYAVVVGGVNMDIGGRPYGKLVPADSNPGQVRMSLGGVGRNIAHNLALLGADVRMLTAFGDDMNAQRIAASCGELGIDISQCLTVPGAATSTYLFLADEKGDMALAVSDMEIYEHVTPAFLAGRAKLLQNAQLIVADTNIPAESLAWLAENIRLPIFADPVSTAKAEKLRPVLGKLHTLKPNRLEAELLSGVRITDRESLDGAVDALLATGLRRVFVSLGADGVYAADHKERLHVPCCPGTLVNATGCGDAAMAAIAWAYLEGTGLADTARAAMAAGADIILEKPVALTEAEGAAIAAASRQYQKQIAVCFSYRFSALVQAAKAAVEAGEIGNLYMIRVRFAHQGPIPGWATTDWFYDPELAGGGAVLDMGIHAIDLVRHLAGEITEVSAFAGTLRKPIKLEDNLVAIFRLAGPCFGYIESGWTSAAGFNGIELMGDKGEITVNYSTNQATVTTGTIHPDGTTAMTTRIIAENGESPWKIQMREFLAAYRDGRPLAPTIDDGVTALKIALAAYQASATGKSVKF